MDSVIHFETLAKDLKRASAFYTKALGWQINKYYNDEYWLLGTAPSDKNGRPASPAPSTAECGRRERRPQRM